MSPAVATGAALAMLVPGPVLAQEVGGAPAGSGVIVPAVEWLQGTLLGTVATVIAVIAVAAVGLMMLTGRTNWRYGATVILGCFILFGAPTIAAGILGAAQLGSPVEPRTFSPSPPPLPVVKPTAAYDPYAGAAVPQR